MAGTSYSSSDESFSAYDSDEEEETTSGADPELSARLIEALSPTGFMYGTLWPIIIENADREQRVLCLCYVNQFFASVVRRVTSDCAKRVGELNSGVRLCSWMDFDASFQFRTTFLWSAGRSKLRDPYTSILTC